LIILKKIANLLQVMYRFNTSKAGAMLCIIAIICIVVTVLKTSPQWTSAIGSKLQESFQLVVKK